MSTLDTSFWTERYEKGHTGWDIGMPSPPLIEFSKGIDKKSSILLPGAGNAHEWKALKDIGFSDITVLDISPFPIDQLKKRFPEDKDSFILGDFFEHEGSYDLILEQTFFCALDPVLRASYVAKMHSLLSAQGTLAGVLFDRQFEKPGPPFGGSISEYEALFRPHFYIHTLAPCYNSIGPRKGTEAFFRLSPL